MSFFSLDSKFMQALGRIYDFAALNLLFLLTSLPIFTLGASSAALYSVCFRLGTDREDGIYRRYFRAFRENFLQGTAIFLTLLLVAAVVLLDLWFFSLQSGIFAQFRFLTYPLLALVALTYAYAFPLLSQFRNTYWGTLKNAVLLSLGYLPRSLVMAVLNLLPLAIFLLFPGFFFRVGLVWILFYFTLTACCNARLLRKVFAPFMPEEEPAAQ